MASFPAILPIFPLTGVLLLPGMGLPLHIFEPRYRHMVAGALAEGGHIGMIQPKVPRQDNRPLPGAELEVPDLYPVGCAGQIEKAEETPDGRYLIQLRGAIRFRVEAELPLLEGYRRVTPDYAPYALDTEAPAGRLDGAPLLEALRAFSEARGMAVDWSEVEGLAPLELLNGLAMSFPFAPAEKQALLEALTPADRQDTLIALLSMGSTTDPESGRVPPGVN